MKKSKEYIKNIDSYLVEEVLEEFPLVNSTLKEIIRQAQLDAIEETCKVCAENAKLLFHDGFYKEDKQLEYFQSGENNLQISKQSILNCAEILKKELE